MADSLAPILSGLALLLIVLTFWTVNKNAATSQRLERKLNLLLEKSGLLSDHGYPEVFALLQKGEKIQTIKRYRELTGTGLAEAKEAVERME
jgi:ribosomal protein L7/L12